MVMNDLRTASSEVLEARSRALRNSVLGFKRLGFYGCGVGFDVILMMTWALHIG